MAIMTNHVIFTDHDLNHDLNYDHRNNHNHGHKPDLDRPWLSKLTSQYKCRSICMYVCHFNEIYL